MLYPVGENLTVLWSQTGTLGLSRNRRITFRQRPSDWHTAICGFHVKHGLGLTFEADADPPLAEETGSKRDIRIYGVKYYDVREVAVPMWALFVVLALYPAWAFLRGPVRRHRRRRKNLCLHCAYDLTGNVSGICPECGEGIKAK